MRNANQGMALIVVLMSMVVLLSVVATASVVSLGTRRGTADERVAYQALLTAESGINSFEARVDNLPLVERYRGSTDKTALNSWLTQRDFHTLSFDNASTAISVIEVTPMSMTLQSISNVGTARGSKTVLQEVVLRREGGMNIRVPAALTSWPDVKAAGSAAIGGQSGQSETGLIDNITRTNASTNVSISGYTSPGHTFALTVDDVSLIRPRSYITINEQRYKVEAVNYNSNTLTLKTLAETPPSGVTISGALNVNLIPYAAAQPVTSGGGFKVSDASGFLPNDVVHAGSFKGRVTSVNYDTGTLMVDWAQFGPAPTTWTPIPEGTPLRRDVFGAASASNVTVSGSAVIEHGIEEGNTTIKNPYSSDPLETLFYQTFGMTKTDFAAAYPPTTWSNPGPMSGIKYVSGNYNLGGSSQLCGSGILVVRGNLTVNGTCAAGFKGVIYVMGNYNQQGNSTISGAVVAEGTTEFGNSSEDSTVAGTGQGNAKIQYDERALLEAGAALSPLEFTLMPGTWRQR